MDKIEFFLLCIVMPTLLTALGFSFTQVMAHEKAIQQLQQQVRTLQCPAEQKGFPP